MPASLYPGAVFKPITYRKEAGAFTAPPLGWVVHVVVGNGSPFGTFQNAKSPNRRFSHFWVSKAGHVEQYQTTDLKSWAQGNGNGKYWSVETEGFPNEKLTDAQILELAKLHNFLGAPDEIANTVGAKGVGTHYMGGKDWGGHSCPDPEGQEGKGPRSLARRAIIERAVSLRKGPPLPPVVPEHLAVWRTAFVELVDEDHDGTAEPRSAADLLLSTHRAAVRAVEGLAALSATVDALRAELAALRGAQGG